MTDQERQDLKEAMAAMELRLSVQLAVLQEKVDAQSNLARDMTLMKVAIAVLAVVMVGKIAGVPLGQW